VMGRKPALVTSKRLFRRFDVTRSLHLQDRTTLEHETDTVWKWGNFHNSEANKNSITSLWKLGNSNFLYCYKRKKCKVL